MGRDLRRHLSAESVKDEASAAAVGKSLLQACRGHAERVGDRKNLDDIPQVRDGESVVAELAGLPGSRSTHVNDVRAMGGKDFAALFQSGGIRPHEASERPCDRSGPSSADRGINEADFLCFAGFLEGPRLTWVPGGMVHKDRAGGQGVKHSPLQQFKQVVVGP